MSRATILSPQDFTLLDQWGRQLREAFHDPDGPDVGPFLVGSAVNDAKGAFRDIDVRMLSAEPWLVGPTGYEDGGMEAKHVVRLRHLNLAVTLWGRQVTGLPIDFQFQPHDEFHHYDGSPRNPLGLRSEFEGRAALHA